MHEATLAKEESLALLDTLLASAPIGFGFLDREFRYVRLNQALADINGLPISAHLGRTPHEVNPQLTPVLDPLRRYAIENGKPILNAEVSGETRAAPGQRRHWLVSYYPVFTSTRSLLGLGIVVTDISVRQRVEETLRQARDDLERRVQERTADLVEANARLLQEMAERQQAEAQLRQQQETLHQREKLAAMGSLLASVAHELNNPLSIVMMQADLLREESGNGPMTDQARAITQAVERCMRIVQHFLTLARQHPPERRPVHLNTIMEEAIELLAYALRVDNIEVDLRLAHDLPALSADRYQLQQVVVNLVTNAHQALREVPTPRRLTLTTSLHPAKAYLPFEVADTGPGIPLALQSRIFEPFFTTKPHGIGTGLGLSLCRGIIEGHGGTLSVQSQPGQGTVFSVELPLVSGNSAAPDAPGDEALSSSPARPATILVIDDEPGIASALVHVLSRSGHAVETAANGRLALAKLEERPFDLILCDLRMPELDGPGFYHELAQRSPQLLPRIIFLTGDTLSPEARAFLDQVGVARLHKPFRAAEVRRIVHQALQSL
jgi:PAS domain S-box-containing protein